MTVLDAVAALIFLAYAVLGATTGTVRRVIGIAIVYVALIAGTYMGQPGGNILNQWNNTIPAQDERLYGWLFFFLLLLIALEGAATAIHGRLQLAVVAFDRGVGVLLGLVTALVMVISLFYMGAGYSRAAINQPSGLQSWVRDQLSQSHFVLPLAKATGPALLPLLAGGLPRDSQAYFTFKSAP